MPEPTVSLSVRLPERVYRAAKRQAKREELSLAAYIVGAVAFAVESDREPKQAPPPGP